MTSEYAALPLQNTQTCTRSFCNRYNSLRISMIFINTIFILTSLMYALGQILELQLVSWFCPKKSMDVIKQNSIANGYNFGTNDECWTTSTNKVELKKLFYAGSYIAYEGKWTNNIADIIKCILFFIPSIILCLMWLYFTFRLFQDICVFYLKNWYQIELMKQKAYKMQCNNHHTGICSFLNWKCCVCLRNIYSKLSANDSTGWIIKTLVIDNIKIILQTISFFRYGGAQNQILYIFDNKNNITPAEQSKYVILFAIYLSLHYIIWGITWICYIFKHQFCIGRFFKSSIFIINAIFDIFYFIYPLLLLGGKNWTKLTTIMAKLHIDDIASLLATLFPLYFLCWKIYRIWFHSTRLAHEEWIKNVLPNKKHSNLSMQMTNLIASSDINVEHYDDLYNNFQDNRKCLSDKMPQFHDKKLFLKELCKRLGIIFICLSWIVFGILIFIFTINHFNKYTLECNDYVKHKNNYPELFLWKYCNYKVYPFFADNKYYGNGLSCNCRSFILEYTDIEKYKTYENKT
eukprot:535838_1